MAIEKKTVKDIKIAIGLKYTSILTFSLHSQEGEHASAIFSVEVSDNVQQAAVSQLNGTDISITINTGESIFAGVIVSAGISEVAGYKTVNVKALSASYKMDQEKKGKTFPDPGKTIGDVFNEVGSSYGAIFEFDSNDTITQVIEQKEETDWAFIKRIAASLNKAVYAEATISNIYIYVGKTGFRFHGNEMLEEQTGISRNIGEMAAMEANGQAAEGYMVDKMSANTAELTISAGDHVDNMVVRETNISLNKGEFVNNVSYGYPESVHPTVAEAVNPGFSSNIMRATVDAVAGNMIKVSFQSQGGSTSSWIPYESPMSNAFYCMPDEGDSVFIYFENNGKIICLGSCHVNTSHPDMLHPNEKTFTNKNKMIKHTDTAIKFTATRDKTDDESEQAIHIIMDDQEGITFQSGKDVVIYAGKSINLGVDVPEDAGDKLKEGKEKFAERIKKGREQFQSEGGYVSTVLEQYVNQKIEQGIQGLKDMTFYDLWHKEEEKDNKIATEHDETGVLTLYGYQKMELIVGDSSIKLDENVNIKSEQFQWLGYVQGEHEKQEVPLQDWWETALDGLQLVLDIAGCFPVLGAVPDLLNAGISLCRGDVAGAGLSLLCAIPGVGDAVGAAKVGVKSIKAVSKITKALSKFKKMFEIAKGIYMIAQGAYAIYQTRDGWAEIYEKWQNGENPFTDPECVSTMINTANGAVTMGRGAKGVADATGVTDKIKGSIQKKKEEKTAKKAAKEKATATEQKTKTCKNDPIDVITGSMTVNFTDLELNDIQDNFILKRTYESVYTNRNMMLGKRWFFNIETRVQREDDKIILQKKNMSLERFVKVEERWVNERNGDKTFELKEIKDGYLVKDRDERREYLYDEEGRMVTERDQYGNETIYEYQGRHISKVILTSGQTLSFYYENDLLVTIKDQSGRTLSYAYDKDLLTEVTLVNGGKIRYTYTTAGFIHTITDPNGNTYVTNEYDTSGRVVRQNLVTGEEYFIFYDDKNRTNTFTNANTGERIIYEYDARETITRQTYHDGSFMLFEYDQWHNCISRRDRNGNIYRYEYDEYGNLLTETSPNGLKERYTYDEYGNILSYENSDGRYLRYEYDRHGAKTLMEEKLSDGIVAVTRYENDEYGRVLEETNPNGNVTTFVYKNLFNKASIVELPEGETRWYEYDEQGRCVKEEDEDGATFYAYNRADALTVVEDALGNITRYSYDNLGNLLSETKPVQVSEEKQGTTYRYDAMNNCIKEVTPEGDVYRWRYGNEDILIKSINPNATAEGNDDGISYEYDSDNRRIITRYPDGGVERYFYDGNGNIIKKITPELYAAKGEEAEGYCYEYDKADRLIKITDPEGNVTANFAYDGEGRLLFCDDKNRQGYGYHKYDLAGRRTETRIPVEVKDGVQLYELRTFAYDLCGNLTEEVRYLDLQDKDSKAGRCNRISYSYDKSNHLIRVTDITGASIEYFYDKRHNLIKELKKISEEVSAETRYVYDKRGRLTDVYEKLEEEAKGYQKDMPYAGLHYQYDGNDNLLTVTLPDESRICYTYDQADRCIREQHKDKKGEIDQTIEYTYDHADQLIRRKMGNGAEDSFGYDLMLRQTSHTYPDGGIEKRGYSLNGRMTRLVTPRENAELGLLAKRYNYQYDQMGRPVMITAPDGTVLEKRVYTPDGLLKAYFDGEMVKAQSDGVRYDYDQRGALIAVTTPGGSSQNFVRDAAGHVTGESDGNHNRTDFELDAWGRVVRVIRPDGVTEEYTYDHAGNIISQTDGEGNVITRSYNCRNLLDRRTDALGSEDTFQYDLRGNMVRSKDRNGNILTYSYNMYQSMTQRRSEKGDVNDQYVYYPDGRLKSATGGGMRYNYEYDIMNRIIRKSASGRELVSYSYDLNGNRTELRDLTGKKISYSYDRLDRLSSVSDQGRRQALYEYNSNGQVVSQYIGNDILTRYTYDIDGNLTSLTGVMGEKKVPLMDYHYTYDLNGNMLTKSIFGEVQAYQYDILNQLTQAKTGRYIEQFAYDRAGNRTVRDYKSLVAGAGNTPSSLHEEYSYSQGNRLDSINRRQMQTGEESKVTTETFTYDHQGNMLSDGKGTYTYDSANRNVRADMNNGTFQENHYDAEGLRTELVENGILVKFLYDGDRVIAEESAETAVIRYIRGLELITSDGEQARTYYHYASDERGSIIGVLEGADKSTGETEQNTKERLLNAYEYDSFGNILSSVEKIHNRFTYAGELRDPVTNQYYLRARYYNPVIGRFLQEDTYEGDGLNLYSYVRNNPVRYVDPSGHYCQEYYQKQGYSEAKAKKMAEKDRRRALKYQGQGMDPSEATKLSNSVADGKTTNRDANRKAAKSGQKTGTNENGRKIFGPYYDEAVKLYQENPQFFPNPDVCSIVQGEELAKMRAEYDKMKASGDLEAGHHVQGLAFGGENDKNNIVHTGESTIKRNKLTEEQQRQYYEQGYTTKKDYKIAKIVENPAGSIVVKDKTYSFGLNPSHTEATNFQNKVLRWQREVGLRG